MSWMSLVVEDTNQKDCIGSTWCNAFETLGN